MWTTQASVVAPISTEHLHEGPRDEKANEGLYCFYFDCVVIVDTFYGTRCNNPNSIELVLRNDCNTDLALKYGFGQADGTSDCGTFHLSDGETGGAGVWACDTTGELSLQLVPEKVY